MSGLTDQLTMSGLTDQLTMSGLTDQLTMSGLTDQLTMSGLTDQLTMSGLTDQITMSGLTDQLTMSGLPRPLMVSSSKDSRSVFEAMSAGPLPLFVLPALRANSGRSPIRGLAVTRKTRDDSCPIGWDGVTLRIGSRTKHRISCFHHDYNP